MPSLSDKVKFDTGAVRAADVAGSNAKFPARYDLITPHGLRRVAETYGEGSAKYGDRNWEKGIPMSVMANHALAHIFTYLTGDRSEDHLAHAVWNLLGMIHFEETRPLDERVMDLGACPRLSAKPEPLDSITHMRFGHDKAVDPDYGL